MREPQIPQKTEFTEYKRNFKEHTDRLTSDTIKKRSQNINKISITGLKRPNTGQDDDDDDTEVMERSLGK